MPPEALQTAMTTPMITAVVAADERWPAELTASVKTVEAPPDGSALLRPSTR